MSPEFDVVIIGAGVAGLAFANALKNSPLKVLLLERKPKLMDVNRGDTLYPHSLDILEKWGVKQNLINNGAIKSQKISLVNTEKIIADLDIISSSRAGTHEMLSLQHELIEKSLFDGLLGSQNITLVQGANVHEFVEEDGQFSLEYKHDSQDIKIKSRLFVAADGRDSLCRTSARIAYPSIDFDHNIVILDSTLPANYNRQNWFLYGKDYKLIIGPLPGDKVRVSIIVSKDETMKWMQMSAEEATQIIRAQSLFFSQCVITKSQSHLYELRSCLAEKFNEKNLVLIGDSAHTVHPISGQGMSLAISDADSLATLLLQDTKSDFSSVAQKYSESRVLVISSLQNEVNNLGSMLMSEDSIVKLARLFMISTLNESIEFEERIEKVLQAEIEKF